MQLSPVTPPPAADTGTTYQSKWFGDPTVANVGSSFALTSVYRGEGGELIAKTQALAPQPGSINLQSYRLPISDPRIAGVAQLFVAKLDAVGSAGPAEQPRVDSYNVGMSGTRTADGTPFVEGGFYPLGSAPQAVLDAKAAAVELRNLLLEHGVLSESNPR